MAKKAFDLQYDYAGLGRRIQILRKERGYTQEQLAEKINCSVTHLARIEHGFRPSLEWLLQISLFLNISLDDLIGITPSSRSPILREVIQLFLAHSTHHQQLALRMLITFFSSLEQAENKPRNKTLNMAASYAPSSSGKDSAFETWNCRPV